MAWLGRDPKLVGGLAGVPTHTRDYANRLALDGTIRTLEAEKKDLEARIANLARGRGDPRALGVPGVPDPPAASEPTTLRSQLDSVQKRLDGCKALEWALKNVAQTPDHHLEWNDVYLLDFDPNFADGDGRAVVALGDPSTAKDVGVIVPGIRSTLSGLKGRKNALRDAADLRATRSSGRKRRRAPRRLCGLATTHPKAWLRQGSPTTPKRALQYCANSSMSCALRTSVPPGRTSRCSAQLWQHGHRDGCQARNGR
jgi:hypothetical protein